MSYSKVTLLFDIKRLFPFYQPQMQNWIWEADKGKIGHRHVIGDVFRTSGSTQVDQHAQFIISLHLHCWYLYNLTHTDQGLQIIGREWDTDPFSLSAANIPDVAFGGYQKSAGHWQAHGGPAGLNLSPGARGNVLKMDKWHPTMNDCWVLGGVHRLATFKLVSPKIPQNIWNHQGGYFIVTAREILGLIHFGYQSTRERDSVLFTPKDTARARGANLVDYWKHIQEKSQLKTGVILELLDRELKANIHAELLAFDKSKLRHVDQKKEGT